MLELILIKHLLLLENYNKYRSYIKIQKDNKELTYLYSVLDKLISGYNRDISFEEYKLCVVSDKPDYLSFLDTIESSTISDDILRENVKRVVDRALAYDLALLSIDVSEGRKELDSILEYYHKFEKRETVEPTAFITDNLEELYNETLHDRGLRWRLASLNKSLGSLRKGDFGFVFARPETGKTTFLASEVSYFAEQVDRPILWFNNEEGGAKVKVRIYQGALGVTLPELYMDREKSYNRYMQVTKGNIKLYDSATVSKQQIERIVKEMNPACILFDQIDKIKGFNADREDLRLGSIYIWARELAKEYCPVIGICQSDVSGEGKRWLTMDNVANAKTSKQAEADWILGIGATHETGMEHVRYLHLSKNKLSGDSDSSPELRHGKFECIIEPHIARYRDL